MHIKIPKHIALITVGILLVAPVRAITLEDPFEAGKPFEQEFLITGYYSALPGQCCYIKGGLTADRILNGEGEIAADGTSVYPGMIAAPSEYPFGTVIHLPGIGIFKVHDRGGAINILRSGEHRLDIWTGHGEEGLARALAVGLQSIKGTIYPPGSTQPEVLVDLSLLPAPHQRLSQYQVEGHRLVGVTPSVGDRNYSVFLLQEILRDLGYLQHAPTGFYGEETSGALEHFVRDFELQVPVDHLSDALSAHIVAARDRRDARFPVSASVDGESSQKVIQEAQRILRYLGYYEGRTDGRYSDELARAILTFQQELQLVGTETDPGAGRIGPITQRVLQSVWNRRLVSRRAERLLDLQRIDQILSDRRARLERYLGEGESGSQVTLLQELLANQGFFPEDKINGNFGVMTKEAVIEYQLANGIIESQTDSAAGYVGSTTLNTLRGQQKLALYQLVRGAGWGAL